MLTSALGRLGFLVVCLTQLAGCAATPRRSSTPDVASAAMPDASFPHAAEIMAGMDPLADDAEWRIGDRLLYGIQLQDNGERVTRYALVTLKTPVLRDGTQVIIHAADAPPYRWDDVKDNCIHVYHASAAPGQAPLTARQMVRTLSLSIKQEPRRDIQRRSDSMVVAVDLFDADARLIACSFACVPEALLRSGLYGYAHSAHALREKYGDEPVGASTAEALEITERLVDFTMTMQALYDMLWTCPNLEPLLKAVIQPPSLLSILWHRGVMLGVDLTADDLPAGAHRAAAPDADGSYPIPVQIRLNDAPTLTVNFRVRPPQPPLQLAGGVVGMDAQSIPRPGTVMQVRLLSARRGVADERPAAPAVARGPDHQSSASR